VKSTSKFIFYPNGKNTHLSDLKKLFVLTKEKTVEFFKISTV